MTVSAQYLKGNSCLSVIVCPSFLSVIIRLYSRLRSGNTARKLVWVYFKSFRRQNWSDLNGVCIVFSELVFFTLSLKATTSLSLWNDFLPSLCYSSLSSVSSLSLLPECIRHARNDHQSRRSEVSHHRQLYSVWALPVLQGNSGFPQPSCRGLM